VKPSEVIGLLRAFTTALTLGWLLVLSGAIKSTQHHFAVVADVAHAQFQAMTNLQGDFARLQEAHIALQQHVLHLVELEAERTHSAQFYTLPGIWQTNPPIWQTNALWIVPGYTNGVALPGQLTNALIPAGTNEPFWIYPTEVRSNLIGL